MASAPHLNPEVLLVIKVLDSNNGGLEVVLREEEVINQEDRGRFPLVEVDIALEEDLEATL